MKRTSSVWMAAAKNLWWKLLLVLLVLAAAEIGLCHWSIRDFQIEYESRYSDSFYAVADRSKLQLVFFAALAVLTACCCLQGCRFNGKNLYTLQRLPLSEWQITLHWALVHLACFVILWAVQVFLIFVLWRLYAAEFSPAAPDLELLVSIYRSNFFHGMLPLADMIRWVYLLTYWLCMGWLTASFGFFQRRGRFRIGLLVMLGCYFTLTVEMGNFGSNMIFTILCLIVAAIDVFGMWEVYHGTQPD